MTMAERLTYEELEARLRETEEILTALRAHEVDAIIGDADVAVVRLKEVEEALKTVQEELEQRVVERTAELARVNKELHDTIAEQERTHRRLEDSERKYRELVENANSIILRRDVDGRITFFNEYAQKFFGYSDQEILGKNLVGTIVPEVDSAGVDRRALTEEIGRHPEQYATIQVENVRHDGQRVWIAWTHRPIRDENGRVVEMLSIGNDVTQLRRAEELVRETQRRLLKAQQIAHLGNWEDDLEHHNVWWSDETYRLLGLEPGQVEPGLETMLSFTHPDDREALERAVREALEGGHSFSIDHRVIRPDGEERFVHSEAEIEFNAEGKVVRIIGIIECITDRKKAQSQLEDNAAQLQSQAELLDLAHDMIFVHDMEGRITFWNRGAEQTYGWTRDEAQGQLSHRLLQTEYSEPLIRITARIVREGRWEGELVHTTRDGRKITVASRWALRRGPGGRPIAILEIDNDITDRKRAEQEMAEAKRFAESIVDTIQECLVVLDSELRVISANRSFYETFKTTARQVEGALFCTLNRGRWDDPELRGRLRDVIAQKSRFEGYELYCDVPGIGRKVFMLSAQPISGPADLLGKALVVIQDISVQKRHEEEIQSDKEQLSALTEELLTTEERQRQRVAAALHDSICQSLAFAKRELAAMEQRVPQPVRESLGQVEQQVAQAINQARGLTMELAPSVLYTLGLDAAIEDLADQFRTSNGFACEVRADEAPKPMGDEVKSLLYRSVRELLVNVSKHAEAKNVSIDIHREGLELRISVEDDGKGFSPSDTGGAESCGFGLVSIRQRLTHLGGKIIIESGTGKGTKVTLIAPLDLA